MLSETALPLSDTHSPHRCDSATPPRYSLQQRLRSGYHGFWYRLSNGLRWSLGEYREQPADHLCHLTPEQRLRVAVLQRRYDVKFESYLNADTALKNYDYLDVLDQAWAQWDLPRPSHGMVCDVGCANFWYVRALQAFFRPAQLTGVEIDGYRLYRDGHSRWDYAQGYLRGLRHVTFVVEDYARVHRRADVITAWFPFVTPGPLLAWRLPLSLLAPQALIRAVAANLHWKGLFVMANHNQAEADLGAQLCREAGLEPAGSTRLERLLRPRAVAPVLSCWRSGYRTPARQSSWPFRPGLR